MTSSESEPGWILIQEESDFQQLYDETRRTLSDLRAGEAAEMAAGDALRGVGSAADGEVRATVLAGGVLESVVLDPRALRGAPEELGARIAESVNAAFDDLARQSADSAATSTGAFDSRALMSELEAAQDLATDRMSMFGESLDDALRKIELAATDGNPGRYEQADFAGSAIGRIMAPVGDLLAAFRAPDDEREPLHGSGSSADGSVLVVVDARGHMESVEFGRRAVREGSELLGERVVEATQVAQADLHRQQENSASPGPAADAAEFTERLLEVQKDTTVQLVAMVDGLRASLDKISRAAGTADDSRTSTTETTDG